MTELDPHLNILPESLKNNIKGQNIHLIGIGGVAMSALAGLLIEKGACVSGSDSGLYPPVSDLIKEMPLDFREGYGPETLPDDCQLVVIGNVVSHNFPVLSRIKEKNIAYLSLPQAMGEFFLKQSKNIVVAGCHGKTTTTAMCSKLFFQAGQNPGFLIGGASLDFPKPWAIGGGDIFIIEGDEYDSAFFNKKPKFIHYKPHTVILTSVEFDHADIYSDLEAVKEAFRSLMRLIPAKGRLIAYGDDPRVREVAKECRGSVEFYGEGEDNDWRLESFYPNALNSDFELSGPSGFYCRLSLGQPGVYNALNALATAAVFVGDGGDPRYLNFSNFKGVKRRQELLLEANDILLIDDFAHHPSAVEKTLSALKAAYKGRRILAAFEPRSNTSLRAVFQDDYAKALKGADLLFLRRPPQPEKAPEGNRLDAELLAENLKAFLFDDGLTLGKALLNELRSGDIVLVMSNGGFDGLAPYLKNAIKQTAGGHGHMVDAKN